MSVHKAADIFHLGGNGLRITIGTEEETRGLIAALRKIVGADA